MKELPWQRAPTRGQKRAYRNLVTSKRGSRVDSIKGLIKAELDGYTDGQTTAKGHQDTNQVQTSFPLVSLAMQQGETVYPTRHKRALGYATMFLFGYLEQTRTFEDSN